MSELPMPGGEPPADAAPICPWCSAPMPDALPERCPSCFATLHETEATEVPGLTRIDHEALLRSRTPGSRPGRLIGWLSGEPQARAADAPGTLAPPTDDVRREMLRLELAALEAEVHAREVEAAALAAVIEQATRQGPAAAGEAEAAAGAAADAEDADAGSAAAPAADVAREEHPGG